MGGGIDETKLAMCWQLMILGDGYTEIPYTSPSTLLCFKISI